MFTGIIEALGEVISYKKSNTNLDITIMAEMASELKIDQSVSHNGVCLTVVAINDDAYTVTAIQETLDKSNLGDLTVGGFVNLERSLKIGDRLDGHIVQGHVDQIATCQSIENNNGSWIFTFEYDSSLGNVTIEKGSITINGVSLTVIDSQSNSFSVAIIPYTYNNTTFKYLREGDLVNLEFDVVGKYVKRLLQN